MVVCWVEVERGDLGHLRRVKPGCRWFRRLCLSSWSCYCGSLYFTNKKVYYPLRPGTIHHWRSTYGTPSILSCEETNEGKRDRSTKTYSETRSSFISRLRQPLTRHHRRRLTMCPAQRRVLDYAIDTDQIQTGPGLRNLWITSNPGRSGGICACAIFDSFMTVMSWPSL